MVGDLAPDQLTLDAATEAAILDTAASLGIEPEDVNVPELMVMLGWTDPS